METSRDNILVRTGAAVFRWARPTDSLEIKTALLEGPEDQLAVYLVGGDITEKSPDKISYY